MMHEPLLARILKAVDKAKLPEDKYYTPEFHPASLHTS